MKSFKVQVSDAVAARLVADAEAADVPVAGFAAALLAEALEARLFGGDSAPQPGSRGQGVPEGTPAAVSGPQAVARMPVSRSAQIEEPDETVPVSLALAFLRDDREGAAVILNHTSLPLLIAATMAWFNGEGIKEFGRDGWEARLVAFLAEAARRRAASPPDDHSA